MTDYTAKQLEILKTIRLTKDLFPETINPQPMRDVLHEEIAKLNDATIRLLRCRTIVHPKEKPEDITVKGRTNNELVASYWDAKKAKWRDYIRMIVADCMIESMPMFLNGSVKLIKSHMAQFSRVDKIERNDCQTVTTYKAFAEALQRRPKPEQKP